MFAAEAADQTAGVLFLAVLLTATAIWWMIMRRRQSWWFQLSQRPRDITGERWIRSNGARSNEARADKPMPQPHSVVSARGNRRIQRRQQSHGRPQ